MELSAVQKSKKSFVVDSRNTPAQMSRQIGRPNATVIHVSIVMLPTPEQRPGRRGIRRGSDRDRQSLRRDDTTAMFANNTVAYEAMISRLIANPPMVHGPRRLKMTDIQSE